MAYKALVAGNAYLLRWELAELGDSPKIAADVKKAGARLGTLMNYVAIVPQGMPPPEDRVRSEIAQVAKEHLLNTCSKVFLVVEEHGFKGAAIRMIATGMFLLIGKRERVRVFETLQEALAHCDDLSVSIPSILSSAGAKGLIS